LLNLLLLSFYFASFLETLVLPVKKHPGKQQDKRGSQRNVRAIIHSERLEDNGMNKFDNKFTQK